MNLLIAKVVLKFWPFTIIKFGLSFFKLRYFVFNICIIKFISQNIFDISITDVKIYTSNIILLVNKFG